MRISNNLNISIMYCRLLQLFNTIVDEYNTKLHERNKKQLKLEEF